MVKRAYLFAGMIGILSLSISAYAQLSPYAESAPFSVDTAIHILDTDGDGLPDWWEELYFGGPTAADPNTIMTTDGLTNMEKYNGGWNPLLPIPSGLPEDASDLFALDMRSLVPDTDGDGLPDWWEELYFGGPTAADPNTIMTADGLTNMEKYNGGWNPLEPVMLVLSRSVSADLLIDTDGWPGGYGVDTDGDGMPDWWEVKYGFDPLVDDADEDGDGDGNSNLTQYLLGMIPFSPLYGEHYELSMLFLLDTAGRAPDTDGDGLPDWWEELYFGGATAADANAIMTADGLTNLEKYNAGWNPWHPIIPAWSRSASPELLLDTDGWPGGYGVDTDGDGMPDWWEVKYGMNPLVDDAEEDLDGDGFSNIDQYKLGMIPFGDNIYAVFEVVQGNIFLLDTGGRFADEDGDGIPDWWERRYTGSNTGMDAHALAAGGMTYLDKFIAYLDPTDPYALFVIDEITTEQLPDENAFTIRWPTASGRLYKLFASDNLSAQWPETAIYQVEGDGTVKGYTVYTEDSPPRFFKITVELLPRP